MTFLPRRRPGSDFPVVIGNPLPTFQTLRSPTMSAPERFKHGVRSGTETAPNSYTGSGRCMFPCNDGVLSSPSKGIAESASQKPLRATCRPSKSASSIREGNVRSSGASRGIETSRSPVRQPGRIGSVLRRLCRWAASAGPVTFESLGHRRGGQSKRMRSCLCRSGILAGSRRRC